MRKRRLAVHVTLLPNSNMAEYYVEHEGDDGRWELWSEGTSTPSNVALAAYEELMELCWQMTGGWSLSTSPGSS